MGNASSWKRSVGERGGVLVDVVVLKVARRRSTTAVAPDAGADTQPRAAWELGAVPACARRRRHRSARRVWETVCVCAVDDDSVE